MESIIPVYIINLKERHDRLQYVQQQFKGRTEFEVNVVEAIKHQVGAIGLWQTIQQITSLALINDLDYFILCEDDHHFASGYNKDILFECINEARTRNADILLGGPSWVSSILPITDKLHWVESFTGLQFAVIFKKFYKEIKDADFSDNDGADLKLGRLTQNKYFIYPFISTQKEFGYSDATPKNNVEGRVNGLFLNCAESIRLVNHVKGHYQERPSSIEDIKYIDRITIPTYVINLPERTDRRDHIKNQFADKVEFDVTFVEACRHEIGAVGLWKSIRKVITMAIENDDDVIIICEDDHQFTPHYSKGYLLRNIMEACEQGVDYLSGGCGAFGSAVPVTENRFWINSLLGTQFIIIYRSLFQRILDEPFTNEVQADIILSEITSNKMIIFPFVSIQRDFGYSDVTRVHNLIEGIVTTLFEKSIKRFTTIQHAYLVNC